MKNKHLLIGLALITGMSSCQNATTTADDKSEADNQSYRTPETKLASDRMTPEVLWSFGRMGGESVSPDGKTVLYGVTYFNKEEDKSYRDLYTLPVAGGEANQITNTKAKEWGERWTKDGHIAFLYAESGSVQVWEMNADGTGRKQLTDIDGGINDFKFSPDETKILFSKEVKLEKNVQDKHPDLDKANARVIGDEFYRHWDHWVEAYTHIFVADFNKGTMLKAGKDIMEGEKWEAPVRPWGGIEQVSWTVDGENIAYSSRKKYGVDYALSTNTDIYFYNLESGETKNVTKGMMGYDNNLSFSPDGKYMAWESMEREGYEADQIRLFVMDLKTGDKKYMTKGFDQNAEHLTWTKDSKSIYFISDWHATDEIYRMDMADGKINKITEGVHNYQSIHPVGDKLIAKRVSMSKPAELYSVDAKTGDASEISFINKHILDQLSMGTVEKKWVETTDGKQMLVWIIKPPHFDKNKKYPAILYCQGGPQGTVSQFWSYRWNFQMMASNDYVIVAPNRRGLPGFGKEWCEQISGDYGGQNMKDYLSAIDNVKEEKYVDEDRLGCVGASYGGFSVYWLAGHHQKRFKAFIAHDGMFNLEAQYLETEEMWFVNWDLGGSFWDKNNKIAQRSYANSPHKFVDKWDTPIMVVHGEKDYRIVASQGMQAFNAARLRGIPAKYLYFPEENHWVLGVQNGILWQREFASWLDKWVKK
ncbi:S9 family peptidase [Ancylomarina sp. 16SWW S1-10-2]|uniref:S9 family peptidase n=1 Tax=Ancylomarina sp. 16SWW S1-10-2 TaxID=2499681 RepID=UPI0012AE227A|nr:S9 family peptidase [Ancylomarina sp. 16SWW S1-10-2]MRT91859.1 S9 family peptidase [Ancylomarina sp. 16SWW S1-10-2]